MSPSRVRGGARGIHFVNLWTLLVVAPLPPPQCAHNEVSRVDTIAVASTAWDHPLWWPVAVPASLPRSFARSISNRITLQVSVVEQGSSTQSRVALTSESLLGATRRNSYQYNPRGSSHPRGALLKPTAPYTLLYAYEEYVIFHLD